MMTSPHSLCTNHDESKRFLDSLAHDEELLFATFDDRKGSDTKHLTHHLRGAFDSHASKLEALNRAGAGVFVAINRDNGTGHRKDDFTSVRTLVVDLDGAPLEPVLEWDHSPHIVVETSPGRWHAYWRVADVEVGTFRDFQKALAARFGGDPSICDVSRVMRIPGFVHRKNEPFVSRIVSIDDSLPTYTAAQMSAALAMPTAVGIAPPRSSSAVEKGHRNSFLMREGGRIRRDGADRTSISAALHRLNAERCDPPLPSDEVERIVERLCTYAASETSDLAVATSDIGNADAFVQAHRDQLRFVPEMNEWIEWNDQCWRPTKTAAQEAAKETAKGLFKSIAEAAEVLSGRERDALAKHASHSLNRARLAAMVALAQTDARMITPAEEIDSDPFVLCVKNGIVDLRSGRFRIATPKDLVMRQAGVAFDPEAKCPTFEAFVRRATAGDHDLARFLQTWIGYALTGSTTEHRFVFMYGHGANGKSTFVDTVRKMLGTYGLQVQPETLMVRRQGNANNDIARLRGARFVFANETREGVPMDESLVKQLVAGDVVTARFLFGEYFDFTPQLKLTIAGNHKPVIRGDDDGIWRRVLLVPFTVQIPPGERDTSLPSKLEAELPGILNWAIEGCLRWQTEGLKIPKVIDDATLSYRSEMDVLGNWLDERCVLAAKASESSSRLFADYTTWCEHGAIKPMSIFVFARKLEGRGFIKEKRRSGNFWRGIQITPGVGTLAA